MSKLREQLNAARQDYLSEKYPGDLAAEILFPPRRINPAWWIAPLAAVAAAVALMIFIQKQVPTNVTDPGKQTVVTVNNGSDENQTQTAEVVAWMTPDAVPSMPDDWSSDLDTTTDTMPSFGDVSIPSMPSMPSFDFSTTEQEST